jgi:hypothetical protein
VLNEANRKPISPNLAVRPGGSGPVLYVVSGRMRGSNFGGQVIFDLV